MTTFTTPTSNHIIATCVENFASQSQTTHGKPQEKKDKAVQLQKIREDILVLELLQKSKYAFIISGLGFTSEYQVGEFNKSK